jgi:WD40 repeat protein
MRRVAVLFLLLLLLPNIRAEGTVQTVDLSLERTIQDTSIGIIAGAKSPDSKDVLLVGEDGFAMLLDANSPDSGSRDLLLQSNRNTALRSVEWHPRGNTALLAGDSGTAMRFDSSDNSLSMLNGSYLLIGIDLKAVTWRPAGDFAYFGASDGSIWKFAEYYGFEMLNDTKQSQISDIACHRTYNICFVTTLSDGIAVISQDHEVTWLAGTNQETWIGIDCADPTLNECVAFGSNLKTKAIKINLIDASQSQGLETNFLLSENVEGDMSGIARGHDSTTLVLLSPIGILRNNPLENDAFSMAQGSHFTAWDVAIAARSVVFAWEISTNNGYLITDFGHVISFSPLLAEDEAGIMTIIVFAAVAVSVPGVILGLIYMNSPFLQRKYSEFRNRKNPKKNRKG